MTTSGFKVESGVQLLSRLYKKPEVNTFYPTLFTTAPKHGDIIEISSKDPAVTFVTDIICEISLPDQLGGSGIDVLVLCTDGNFSMDRLFQVLYKKISLLADVVDERVIQQCLKKIFIVNLYDENQLHSTIQNLECTLMEHPNIGLIILNSITAFYWSEHGFKLIKMDDYLQNMLNEIQNVIKEFKPIVMYTRPQHFGTDRYQEIHKINMGNSDTKDAHYICINTKNTHFEVQIASNLKIKTKNFTIKDGEINWL